MNRLAIAACLFLFGTLPLFAGSDDGRLDLYFVDVEGGAATVIVTPQGESILIDSGYPDNGGRDRDRILDVLKNVARLDHLDHAVVSHWHLDHFGNHAEVASLFKIANFWDRGIPDLLSEDPGFTNRVAPYRSASQNRSKTLKAGDSMPLKAGVTPLTVKVLTASGEVIPNTGEPNPFAAEHHPQPEDTSDNAKSISLLLTFGKFKFLCCGDLTWNTEAKLMTPNNPVGPIELFMATHHGLNVSNNPVMVLALDPRVCVTCNGPTKGADPETIATFKRIKSLQAMYQLHRNVRLAEKDQAPAENIANQVETAKCTGNWIKASVAKDGTSYTIQVGPQGKPRTFETR
ncbi:ComEC/Rec2 family competence protein [Schlesneria sp. T3-172]|uniref:ComEC/Rec2 family competence protein n=1 Tax=Schlesneria sphaerica TaxID=3373610 RepID=UPI0037CC4203